MKPLTDAQRDLAAANLHLMADARRVFAYQFECLRIARPWFDPDDVITLGYLTAVRAWDEKHPGGLSLLRFVLYVVRRRLVQARRKVLSCRQVETDYARAQRKAVSPDLSLDHRDEVRFLGLAGEAGRILLETQREAMQRTGYSDAHVMRLRQRVRRRALVQHHRRK